MKTKEVEILGKKYLMCFSNKVLQEMEQKNINIKDLASSEHPVSEMVDLVHAAINSGATFAKHSGDGEYETIEKDYLLEVTGVDDLNDLVEALKVCMIGDRQVDAVPGKNAGAAPEGRTK